MERKALKGILATLQTPFNNDGSIDRHLFKKNARKLANCGAHGVYCFGSSAEFFSVSIEEFKELTKMFVDEVEDKALKIVGCLSIDLRQIIEKAQYAKACGADAIFTSPPFFNPLSQEEKLLSMREVAKACPDIGVIHYNEEVVRYGMLSAEDYAKLMDVENFWGSKQGDITTTEWMALRKLTPAQNHLAGWDSLLVPAMRLGGKGVFSLLVCLSPQVALDLYNACDQEDWRTAFTLHEQLDKFWEVVYKPLHEQGYADPAIDKVLANVFGFVPGGETRPPLKSVPVSTQKKIRKIVESELTFLL